MKAEQNYIEGIKISALLCIIWILRGMADPDLVDPDKIIGIGIIGGLIHTSLVYFVGWLLYGRED